MSKNAETGGGLRGEALQRALSVAPFHDWLGLAVVSETNGVLELEMPWRPQLVSNPRIGSLHGGILATLIDLGGMYAILMHAQVVATASLHVDYHRPATMRSVRTRSRVVKLGRTLSVAETEVMAEDQRLLASGRGTYQMNT